MFLSAAAADLVGANTAMDERDLHIGIKKAWGVEQPFGFDLGDARYHTYIIGKTGAVKTTRMANLYQLETFTKRSS